MIEAVTRAGLAVNESVVIRKNHIVGSDNKNPTGKRVCVVSGTHGDELEGQYVCAKLSSVLQSNLPLLNGTVDVYPALNPLGIDSITRGIPLFDLDMNRIFPGSSDGTMAECLAADIVADISGADICIDIHSSNIYLREIPQVRINENSAEELVPYAKMLDCDFIWVHASATVLESTLAYSLNSVGTKTLVVEMGVGMRITREYGDRLTEGILNLLKNLGMWKGGCKPVREPIVSADRAVEFVNSGAAGIFVPSAEHWSQVSRGDAIGSVIDPVTGSVGEYVTSPCDGIIFTLREFPIVYGGSLIARILGGEVNA
ncbi:MAG: M14 family metallopeptidase [Lachnospiraceae bacterium]|nr:M14 family metallopeptidase [Ruminococcus sp.]MCM1275911.1 M14 family metallopeptidase [Lachnospiraceae bacterium]